MSALDSFRAPRPAPSPARRLLGLLAMAAAGLAAGVLAKWADFSGIRLLGDVFSELPVWILLGLVIARCSGSPGRAAAHALVFFLAMIPAYYLAAEWMDGVWGMAYVYGWTIVACLSPFAACAVWYAFGRGWLPNVLSVLIVAAALLADPMVLRRLSLRDFVLAGVCTVLVFGWKATKKTNRIQTEL